MKKLIIAAVALIGVNAAVFAQTTPTTKKSDSARVQTKKKQATTSTSKPVIAKHDVKKPAGANLTSAAKKDSAHERKLKDGKKHG